MVVLAAFLVNGALAAPGADRAGGCTEIVSLTPNERYRGHTHGAGESVCYRIDIGTKGIWSAAVTTPGTAVAQPKLRLVAEGALALAAGRSAARSIFRVTEPGTFLIEVAPQDPRTTLGEHTILNRFVADAAAIPVQLGAWPLDKDGAHEEDDPILWLSPAPGSGPHDGPSRQPGLLLYEGGRHGTLIWPGDRSSQVEAARGRRNGHARFYGLCSAEPADDHDAFFLCASPIVPGTPVHGEIVDDWTPDLDGFVFVLQHQRTVRLDLHGSSGSRVTLRDRHGLRLAADTATGEDTALVRTLPPGRYFVQVDGSAGPYSLHLTTSAW